MDQEQDKNKTDSSRQQGDQNVTNPQLERADRNRHPPQRLGEWYFGSLPPLLGPFGTSTPVAGGRRDNDNESVHSHRSRRSGISNISRVSQVEVRRRKLEIELREAEEAAKIEEEAAKAKTNRNLALLKKRTELEKAKLDEEVEGGENWDNNSQKLSEDEAEEKKPTAPKTNKVEFGRVVNINPPATGNIHPPPAITSYTNPTTNLQTSRNLVLHSPTNSYTSSIHDLAEVEETSTTVKKISEAVFLMSKLFEQQMNSKSPNQTDTSNARRTYGKELTPFGGNPEEWPAFISEYNECAELCAFTARENLQRLKKCLKGEAKDTVQALMNSPDNVDRILKTLELRFGTPELIVQRMIEKAKKSDRVKEEKIETLLHFATTVQNLATTAKALKCEYYMVNPQLMLDLLDKLPMRKKEEWCKYSALNCNNIPSVVDFANWLSREAEVLNKLRLTSSCAIELQRTTKDDRTKSKSKQTVLATAGAEDSTANKQQQKSFPPKPCIHCKKAGHDISTCYTFKKLDLDTKWKWIMDHQVCYCCLKVGHQSKVCRGKKECGVNSCKDFHHKILHRESKKNEPPKSESGGMSKEKSEVVLVQQSPGNKVLYKIAHVTLKGPTGEIETCAFLDEGSAFTLLDAKIAEGLGIVGKEEPLTLRGVGTLSCRDKESQNVSVIISGASGKEFTLKNVRTKTNLGLPSQSFDVSELPFNWRCMRNLRLKSMNNEKPAILIGLDNNDLIHTQKSIHGSNHRLTLGKTKLGWTVYGNTVGDSEVGFSMHLQDTSYQDEELHQMVKKYFLMESDGVKILKEKLASKDDERAIKLMEKYTSRIGDVWQTCLLWKKDEICMPASFSAALKRLTSMERKMDKSPELTKLYCEKMQYFFDNNYAKKISEAEANEIGPKTWYLPHFGILNPNKPGKIRFVFDAAAKVNNVSLNDMLLTGSDLLLSLPGCLIKFRQKSIGFTGDIRDFFPSIRMRKEDQCAQRFLWRGMERDRPPDTYEMIVNIFGAACTPYTSQSAKNKNALDFQLEYPEAVKAILKNHYMDDYLDSVDSVEEAVKLILEVIEVHKRGGMQIGKFTSSNKEVLLQIPKELRATELIDLELDNDLNIERVLGLHWDPNSDTLSFNLKFHKIEKEIVAGTKIPTKRQVLRVVMSMFDPLGFLGHFTVQAKILLQDIWRSGLGWDDDLTEQLDQKWKNWIRQLHALEHLKIPRCLGSTTGIESRQLHIFCDASEQAYCAAAYLRIETGGANDVQVSLVMAKTRVAPLKPMTIPKLELQAAVIGSRLSKFIKSEFELELNSTTFWSDNKTVLLWLRSEARNFKTFVAHRVGEVLEDTNVSDWRWVPSKENPADDATRDTEPPDLTSNCRWLNGPDFLKFPKENWPTELTINELKQEVVADDMEIRHDTIFTTLEDHEKLIDVERFSKWLSLIRSMAWALRYVRILKAKARGQEFVKSELTLDEIKGAEKLIIKQAQMEVFGGEIINLQDQKPIPKTSPLVGLSAYLDSDGILKISSRINNAAIAESTKSPIIIHSKHPMTKLLVMYYHEMNGHQGQDRVVNDIRQKFWIIKIRAAVKYAWSSCQLCKNRRARPQVPEMGQLPWVRLAEVGRAFTFTGMDYFGPFKVVEGRRHSLVYGVLFTCLSTRAVHLEIAETLTTDSAIMAIRRFAARRGKPQRIYSDNGTNLRGADNELRDSLNRMNQMVLEATCTSKSIEWHFIPPSAPHMGGSGERMVQSVKKALRSTLENIRTPKREVLQTLFAEAENTVNSRPLTHVSLDPDDPESLTPNHFLIGSSGALPPPGNFEGALDLRKQWRSAEQLAAHFWQRWVREYLPTLTRRTKWHEMVKPVEVGDIVIIVDDQLERNSWPLGRITKTFPGKDNKVRVVEVFSKGKIYKRPVAKICVMDVSLKSNQEGASSAPDGVDEVSASSALDINITKWNAPKLDVEDGASTSEGKMSRSGFQEQSNKNI